MRLLSLIVLVSAILAACTVPTPTIVPAPTQPPAATDTPPPVAPAEPPLYVAIVWHQHQPLYYKDPETGIYTRPWVRVHATKDYYDMAAILKDYPDVHVTFNLTPVLIRQLDDLAAGAKDIYWVLAEKPADQLGEDDKRFILQRFFDVNPKIVDRFPRYKELQQKRKGAEPELIDAALQTYTAQDFRDLQILFNLAWFDPDFLAEEPLQALVAKGRDFAESDKPVLFGKAVEVIREVIPLHKELQDAGQIEVITTPYAHPILPLIYSTKLALVGNPSAEMPGENFSFPNDGYAHLAKSVEIYREHFGREPRGLWPGEGAVAQEIVRMVGESGYTWMASGEQVLAKSIGIDAFTRDSADTVQEADALYRPYVVQDEKSGFKVNMIFRDLRLSDLIGFEYSNKDGAAAAADLMQRLDNIRQELEEQGADGPHLVSIILDGENAWEQYPNDGKAFFHALYEQLSATSTIKTVTPSEFFAQYPPEHEIESLFPGAWFSPNYDTWIGESEEAMAWNYLRRTRNVLAEYDVRQRKTTTPENLARALDFMYLAEGSDWFWWYGADQDSGNDDYFDFGFRALLSEVYQSLGEPLPDFVQAPIVSRKVAQPSQPFQGLFTPTIDGAAGADEWAQAGTFLVSGGAQARAEDMMAALYYGMDASNLYVRADARGNWSDVADGAMNAYLSLPRVVGSSPFSIRSAGLEEKTVLGFAATHAVDVTLADGTAALYRSNQIGEWSLVEAAVRAAVSGSVLEIAIPLDVLSDDVQAGDDLRLAALVSSGARDIQSVPASGPAQVVIPDLGATTLALVVSDPEGDDHGPGTYTYPTDGVFKPGVFDIKEFSAGYDDHNVVFKFTFVGPIPNPWGSPNNLALQTLDVYIDKDPGAGTGARLLLPGRNAALEAGSGWEVAIWAEGWTPQIHAPDATGRPKQITGVELKVLVDPAAQTATLRVPRAIFGDDFDPATAAYLGLVLSQDGFPSRGVWRVRDVLPAAEQWRLGGAPDDTNHTRIIDAAIPADSLGPQEAYLGNYPPSQESNLDLLTPADFPQLPIVAAGL